jgi:hypothetical protein
MSPFDTPEINMDQLCMGELLQTADNCGLCYGSLLIKITKILSHIFCIFVKIKQLLLRFPLVTTSNT